MNRSIEQTANKVEFANTLRGFAALSVLISHYYSVFWFRKPAVATLTHLPQLDDSLGAPVYLSWLHPFPLNESGSFGVALFFLISGFVIPFSLERSSALTFAINRFFRLVPVYICGFSITLLSIFAGVRYFGVPWPFTASEIASHYIPGLLT